MILVYEENIVAFVRSVSAADTKEKSLWGVN